MLQVPWTWLKAQLPESFEPSDLSADDFPTAAKVIAEYKAAVTSGEMERDLEQFKRRRIKTDLEVVAMLRQVEKAKIEQWEKACDAAKVAWLSDPAQRAHIATLFNSHILSDYQRNWASTNLGYLTSVKLPERPVTPFEHMSDPELKRVLNQYSPPGSQIPTADYNAHVAALQAKLDKLDDARDPLSEEQWLAVGAVVFFNSASIAGAADVAGRTTQSPAILKFCKSLGVAGADADAAFKPFWYRPSATACGQHFVDAMKPPPPVQMTNLETLMGRKKSIPSANRAEIDEALKTGFRIVG